ncbi:Abi family protein [Catenisphaera adipataccumulans]|uniref:Abortive infection bacteriophage resistance protein n=1 Tax=Catenisphaera adipataccumulans TaxID=700500 RepID=A0A7W8FYA4_9FIRM|nr:Abi family protein [Catenisphaera adipataccumulans]MBB5183802.1 abortive infection bacteriophage resistance protein [Catenisphaera adipataccumulans]
MENIKPKLSVSEQVDRLKEKGVKFNYYSDSDAKKYLTSNNYYYKLTSFRKNFRKYPSGKNKGKYINLDFAYLVDLAIIDNYLRNIILEIALDIEHYSKLKLLHELENRSDEDGYTIVKDFLNSLGDEKNNLEKRLNNKITSTYVGDIIQHYSGNYPAWSFIEIISFGDYLRFYNFCAIRWNNKSMQDDYFPLKDVKELRNAAAHNNCIINDITIKNAKYRANYKMKRSLSCLKKQRNNKHLSKEKIRQLATLFYYSSYIITSDGVHLKIKKKLDFFRNRIFKYYDYNFNKSLRATFNYLVDIIDIFY